MLQVCSAKLKMAAYMINLPDRLFLTADILKSDRESTGVTNNTVETAYSDHSYSDQPLM